MDPYLSRALRHPDAKPKYCPAKVAAFIIESSRLENQPILRSFGGQCVIWTGDQWAHPPRHLVERAIYGILGECLGMTCSERRVKDIYHALVALASPTVRSEDTSDFASLGPLPVPRWWRVHRWESSPMEIWISEWVARLTMPVASSQTYDEAVALLSTAPKVVMERVVQKLESRLPDMKERWQANESLEVARVAVDALPRMYLATPTEIALWLKAAAARRGDTILYEEHIWTGRAKAAGTVDRIPETWKLTDERLNEVAC